MTSPDDQTDRLAGLSQGKRSGLHGGSKSGSLTRRYGPRPSRFASPSSRWDWPRCRGSEGCERGPRAPPALRSPGPVVLSGDDRTRHLEAGADAKVGPVLPDEVRRSPPDGWTPALSTAGRLQATARAAEGASRWPGARVWRRAQSSRGRERGRRHSRRRAGSRVPPEEPSSATTQQDRRARRQCGPGLEIDQRASDDDRGHEHGHQYSGHRWPQYAWPSGSRPIAVGQSSMSDAFWHHIAHDSCPDRRRTPCA